jgi:hypothetical protein
VIVIVNRLAIYAVSLLILFLGEAFLTGHSVAHAQRGTRSSFLDNLGQGLSKKADERYQDRWTLTDWFETQRRARLQDMWLAGNTKKSSLYEFMIGGRYGSRTTRLDGVEQSGRPYAIQGMASAYATLVGLEGSYVDLQGENSQGGSWGWDGHFAFRPFGDSLQNTGLTLLYGVQYRNDPSAGVLESVQNQSAKARFTLYLTRAFGIEGQYQKLFKEQADSRAATAVEIEGASVEGTVFIDFSLLRISGTWTQETRSREVLGVKTERVRESVDVGLKLFF